ncbi:MAG: GNAT family N-acetyltransferase [Oscillospiraceae bacterium]|nr:GNAT family N-acetyltransferase [Oscillospiraceae bacterium]
MIKIIEEIDAEKKSKVCNDILRALPDWFGIEASIVDYVEQVKTMPFYTVYDDNKPIGFVALKSHSIFTVEIFVMGVLSDYHRQGVGQRIIEQCEHYCKENNAEFLTVKTLNETRESSSYAKTRLFYLSMGFRPLEVFPLLWGEDNPCLFMAKWVG